MNTSTKRRAVRPAGAGRAERAASPLRGRVMPPRIAAISCAALLTGAGLLLVAGCAAGTSGSASSAAGGSAAHQAAGSGAEPAPLSAAGTARDHAANGATGQAKDSAARLAPATHSIIYTASMTVHVRNAAQAAALAQSAATAAGGYTASEQAQLSHSRRQRSTVSLTLKIPVPSYTSALRQLGGLGRQTRLSQQSMDVTQQVADVNSRVTSEQAAIAQLRALLKRTGSVSGLLQVQQQISDDEATLEALQAQQRALSHETTYATITLQLLGPVPSHVVAQHKSHHNFVSGLASGWRGLRHALGWLLTALGTILPFALTLAVIGGLGLVGWRRLGRRRTGPAAPAEPGPTRAG